MRLPYPGQSVLTATFTTAYGSLFHRPIEDRDLEDIQRQRGQVFPPRRPFSWITGPVPTSVGITFGTVQARDGHEIPLRIYRPRRLLDSDTSVPVVAYLHGGGWVQGNVVMYDPLCAHIAEQVGVVAVSVDYRMAPEHPAPTAAHDCIDAVARVVERGEVLRADTSRIALCGDSAGGNLAAVVAQAFRDEGRDEVRHQALLYPATDLTLASPSIEEHAHAPILTRENILAFRAHYLGDGGVSEKDPIVSPLFGELAGLPPTLIQTADLDPIRDDGLRYAAALRGAGVAVRATNYAGAPHGFASFPGVVPCGRQQRHELVSEMRAALSGAA